MGWNIFPVTGKILYNVNQFLHKKIYIEIASMLKKYR